MEKIDQQIETHASIIVSLKRRRNALAPVTRLPSEIFSSIFLHLTVEVKGYRPYNSMGRLMKVLRVCKKWREIGLGDPRLWSYWGKFVSPRCLRTFVAHSKAAPLFVRAIELTPDFSNAWETALRDFGVWNRLRELHITSITRTSMTQLLDALDQAGGTLSTSRLQSLRITAKFPDFESLTLPRPFHTCHFPILSHIQISQLSVDWSSSLFETSNLTYLSVTGTLPAHRATVPQLLAILEKTPMLRTLVVEPGQVQTVKESVATVDLPRLQTIALCGSLDSCMDLLGNIYYSSSVYTKVSIQATSAVDAEGFQSRAIPFLLRHYNKRSSHPINSMTIESIEEETILKLRIWHEKIPDLALKDLPPCGIEFITASSANHLERDSEIAKACFAALPLSNLRKLLLGHIRMSCAEWILIFNSVENLEELKLFGYWQLNTIMALTPKRKVKTYASPPSISEKDHEERTSPYVVEYGATALPKMTRLYLDDFDFDSRAMERQKFSECGAVLIIECLAIRSRNLHHVSYVQILKCTNVSHVMLSGLDDFADEVEWDGEGEGGNDDEDEDEDEDLEDEYCDSCGQAL